MFMAVMKNNLSMNMSETDTALKILPENLHPQVSKLLKLLIPTENLGTFPGDSQ